MSPLISGAHAADDRLAPAALGTVRVDLIGPRISDAVRRHGTGVAVIVVSRPTPPGPDPSAASTTVAAAIRLVVRPHRFAPFRPATGPLSLDRPAGSLGEFARADGGLLFSIDTKDDTRGKAERAKLQKFIDAKKHHQGSSDEGTAGRTGPGLMISSQFSVLARRRLGHPGADLVRCPAHVDHAVAL